MYSKEFVLETVKKNGLELKNFKEFQDDKDVVTKSIEQNALSLQFASNRLKNYKNIVTLAVKNNFRALEFASDRLKNYKTLIIIAVKIDGMVLEFVSDRLRNNKEIALEAVKNNPKAFQFVGDKIKEEYSSIDNFLSFNKIKNNYNSWKDKNIRYLKIDLNEYEEFLQWKKEIKR